MLVRVLAVASTWLLLICVSANAEPMRLTDPTPRWIAVQFEDSPSERPDLLDRVYTQPFAAWLEPDAAGHVVVRIDGDVLERHLFRANDPLPGSFSDYVWLFDPEDGEVLSASFSGAFVHRLDWGFATSDIEARVHASMATLGSGGFRKARSLWGRALHPYCDDVENAHCTGVPALRYDAARGYVNAVGSLTIDSPVTRFATYSAVGEARFSEVEPPAPAEAAATALAEARETEERAEPGSVSDPPRSDAASVAAADPEARPRASDVASGPPGF
jgi:hypothetical protein